MEVSFSRHLNTQLLLLSSILSEDVSSKWLQPVFSGSRLRPTPESEQRDGGRAGVLRHGLAKYHVGDRLRSEDTADIDGHLCPLLAF